MANTIEPSVYSGDVSYVKLVRPLVIFGHVHLDSCIDNRALRVEYCIVGIPHSKVAWTRPTFTPSGIAVHLVVWPQ